MAQAWVSRVELQHFEELGGELWYSSVKRLLECSDAGERSERVK